MNNGDTLSRFHQSFRWLVVLVGVVMIGVLSTAFGDVKWHTQEVCPDTRDEIVRVMLPSITKHLLVPISEFNDLSGGNIFSGLTPGKLEVPVPDASQFEGFRLVKVHLERNTVPVDSGLASYSGSVVDTAAGSAGQTPNSSAAFLLELNATKSEPPVFLSGFLVLNLEQESNLHIRDANNWYFYEPVRPLLDRIVNAMRPENPCTQQDVDHHFSLDDEASDGTIIIYEARDTDFLIDLDPYDVELTTSQGTVHSHSSTSETPAPSALQSISTLQPAQGCTQTTSVNLVPITDQKYYDLFAPQPEDDSTQIQRARRDIFGIETLFTGIGADTNFYCLFGANVGFAFRSAEIWITADNTSDGTTGRGPGADFTSAPNAYQMLCDFINETEHTDSFGDGSPTIPHLMSGWDFSLFPAGDGNITDYGDTFCQSGCGGDGRVIIGLAELIGGFRNATISSCGTYPYNEIFAITVPGHHSVSQHAPKTRNEIATRNMDGTLFQRWALMAHEIGHNLGAQHRPVDSSTPMQSVMVTKLNGRLKHFMTLESAMQINSCITGGNCGINREQ